MGGRQHIGWVVLLGAVCCGGEDPGNTGVDTDELVAHCDRRCTFQATCVPELLEVIGECKKQCRDAFDDAERFTSQCAEVDLREPGDPIGPYTVTSIVEHQKCLISRGCEAMEPCEEKRQLCLDTLTKEERCNRDARIGYRMCGDAFNACYEMNVNTQTCQAQSRICYDAVNDRQQRCTMN